MKTILITGVNGFLGSEIAKEALNYYNVIGLKKSTSKISRIKDVYKIKTYDIDKIDLEKVFNENKIEYVIHTAGLQNKHSSSVYDLIDINVLFTVKLAELSDKHDVKAFLFADTILPKNTNTYSLSKSQARSWLQSFNTTKMKVIDLRLELFFGYAEDDNQFIKSLIIKMINNVSHLDFTKGKQKRDIIYVDDVVSAFLLILINIKYFKKYEEIDVGSSNPISIKNIVKKIKKLTFSKTKLNFGVIPYSKNDLMYCKAKTKSLNKLGWQAKVPYEKALKIMIEKVKNNNL